MSYQVIARKYRPQRFADVVGQEHVTQTLANAITQKRIAHAYLFCGPRGTGKTTIARIFAKCLNCTGGPKVDFDDHDPHVQEITEGRSLDVLEIDGASNNGVEQVRELRETCKYAPANSPFKIYIIDEVHMLSTAAFNALLKTLEEPPAHVKFMFATTDPEKVLPTILSRCQRFDLRRIPSALITRHLADIAARENVTIDGAALHAIARGADGGMRDAESTLDQLISFCGEKIEEPDVLSMFGLAAQNQILKLSRAVLAGEIAGALGQLDELARGGKDLGRLLGRPAESFPQSPHFPGLQRRPQPAGSVRSRSGRAQGTGGPGQCRCASPAYWRCWPTPNCACVTRLPKKFCWRSHCSAPSMPAMRCPRCRAQATEPVASQNGPSPAAPAVATPVPAPVASPAVSARTAPALHRTPTAVPPRRLPGKDHCSGSRARQPPAFRQPAISPNFGPASSKRSAGPARSPAAICSMPTRFHSRKMFSSSGSIPNLRIISAWWTMRATTPCCPPSSPNWASPTP